MLLTSSKPYRRQEMNSNIASSWKFSPFLLGKFGSRETTLSSEERTLPFSLGNLFNTPSTTQAWNATTLRYKHARPQKPSNSSQKIEATRKRPRIDI
uniref:Uncharacterized protein n=1 Tax=Arundo donax TaxID=35708 RepID=A0A0A9D0S3_ARUDO